MNTIWDASLPEPLNGWNQYQSVLASHPRIREVARPHMARWVDRWISEGGPGSEELTKRFFEEICCNTFIKDWQFRQAVFSVELWCRRGETPDWARDFDWEVVADRAEILEDDHPSRLREAVAVSHPRTNHVARYHLSEKSLQRRFGDAIGKAAIHKEACFHTLRHSFATHLLGQGVDLRTIQKWM